MTLIGRTQGNLHIVSLERVDKGKYPYPVSYFNCHCDVCGNDVVLPSTNIRQYIDCGRHRSDKLKKRYPYQDRMVTVEEVAKMARLGYTYTALSLRRGKSVEDIINHKRKKYETVSAGKEEHRDAQ